MKYRYQVLPGLPVLWHKVLYHEPNLYFFIGCWVSVISVIAVLPILRLTAGSITNGPIPWRVRKFYGAINGRKA
jgi:hypothetical protein